MGTILTAISTLIVLMFFYAKLMVVIKTQDVDIMSALKENGLTQEDKFTAKDGLFVAAAITDYDNNPESIEDWRYGELVISTYGWGYTDEIDYNKRNLRYHPCSD